MTKLNTYFKAIIKGNDLKFFVLRGFSKGRAVVEVNIHTGEVVENGLVYMEEHEGVNLDNLIEGALGAGLLTEVAGDDDNPYNIGLFTTIRDTRDDALYTVNRFDVLTSQVAKVGLDDYRRYATGTRKEVLNALTRDLAEGIIVIDDLN